MELSIAEEFFSTEMENEPNALEPRREPSDLLNPNQTDCQPVFTEVAAETVDFPGAVFFETEKGKDLIERLKRKRKIFIEIIPGQKRDATLLAFATCQKTIDETIALIFTEIERNSAKIFFDSEKDATAIQKLTDSQIASMENSSSVKVIVKRDANVIAIEGVTERVVHAANEIQRILNGPDHSAEKRFSRSAAEWKVELGGHFENYPPDVNRVIERAFQKREPFAQWFPEVGNETGCEVNFSAMEERTLDGKEK